MKEREAVAALVLLERLGAERAEQPAGAWASPIQARTMSGGFSVSPT